MVSIKPMFLYGVRGGVQGGVNFTGYPHASVVVLQHASFRFFKYLLRC